MANILVGCGGILCPPAADLVPGVTYKIVPAVGIDRPASLLAVSGGPSTDLSFELRVQDLSRQSQTWGTSVPVVRETEFRSDQIVLADVPSSRDFRYTIRIYEIDGLNPAEVRLRVFAASLVEPDMTVTPSPDRFLGEARVSLRPGNGETTPGYAEIGDLSSFATLDGAPHLVIQLQPLTEGLRIWAFASVTNNETQHVTVIAP